MITSEIIINRVEGDQIKVRFRFVNALGQEYVYNNYVPLGTDVNALLLQIEAQYDQQDIDNEVAQHWAEMENGGNPYYNFADPLWERKTFTFTTFENSFSINIKRALGQEFNYSKSAGVRIIKPAWDAGIAMGDDLRGMLGQTVPQRNAVTSDSANIDSIDTIEAGMNGRHFDDDGLPL